MAKVNKNYLVDSKGRKKAVLVDLKEYEHLLKLAEDMRDLNFIARHQQDELVAMAQVHKKLK